MNPDRPSIVLLGTRQDLLLFELVKTFRERIPRVDVPAQKVSTELFVYRQINLPRPPIPPRFTHADD